MGDEPRGPQAFEGWPAVFATVLFQSVSAYLRHGDPELAQEAVQDTMTKAHERQCKDPSFLFASARALRSFLRQTAIGYVKNEWEQRNRNQSLDPGLPLVAPSPADGHTHELRECIQELPEDEQRRLVALKEEGKTDQEISIAWHGTDEDRFRQRIRRLWEKVRELLRQCLVRKGFEPSLGR